MGKTNNNIEAVNALIESANNKDIVAKIKGYPYFLEAIKMFIVDMDVNTSIKMLKQSSCLMDNKGTPYIEAKINLKDINVVLDMKAYCKNDWWEFYIENVHIVSSGIVQKEKKITITYDMYPQEYMIAKILKQSINSEETQHWMNNIKISSYGSASISNTKSLDKEELYAKILFADGVLKVTSKCDYHGNATMFDLTIDKILNGIKMVIEGYPHIIGTCTLSSIDSEDADAILQCALFGDILYG